MMRTVLFAGGGTGGHLMPALALAEEMVGLDPSIQPYFVGAARGVEAEVLPRRPWRHTLLPFEPISRRRWWKNARLPVALYRSLRGVREVLRREDPVLVVGTGGYAAGPVVWAAAARGVPSVLQEQNAYPGLATRWLAGRVDQIHLGFPEARRHLRTGRQTQVFVSGNPIRPPPEVRVSTQDAKQHLGFDADRPLVLVMGGSQGAVPINRLVRAALEDAGWPAHVQLLWQAGATSYEEFRAAGRSGMVRVEPFIDPVEDAYAAADLVVSRAGAMTLAELTAWGLPAILIPLPTAAARHQLINARTLAEAGAAVLLEQDGATGRGLGYLIGELLEQPAKLADMRAAAGRRGRPRAAREIAGKALELLPKS